MFSHGNLRAFLRISLPFQRPKFSSFFFSRRRFFRFSSNSKNSFKFKIFVPFYRLFRNSFLGVPLGGSALAVGFWGKSGLEESPEAKKEKELIKQADELYDKYEIAQLYNLLSQHENSESSEILWRLARATCEIGKYKGNQPGKDRIAERKAFMYEGLEYAKRALAREPKEGSFAVHKWYAILLNYVTEYEGTKVQLQKSLEVREHFEKAVELNPSDPTCLHLLGLWYYTFADLPSYQRYLASAIFAEVPKASYDDALDCFLKAETTEPGFYSKNLVYIARIYFKKKEEKLAEHYILLGLRCKVITVDDYEAEDELVNMWKKIKGADNYIEKEWKDRPMFVKSKAGQ